VADLFEDGLEVGRGGEAEGAFAEVSGGEDFGFEERLGFVGGVEEKALAGLNLAAGTNQGGPVLSSEVLGEEDFDAAGGVGGVVLRLLAAGAGGVEASRDDSAVVEDQEVAGAEDLGEVAEVIVLILAGLAVEDEHAAGASDGWRGLGDEFFREVEMEVGYVH
jgi:hypothetical protein